MLVSSVQQSDSAIDTYIHMCYVKKKYNRLKKEKMKELASLYGPLTLDEAKQTGSEFLWTVQPWPWEGGME